MSEFLDLVSRVDAAELADIIADLPDDAAAALLQEVEAQSQTVLAPVSPLDMAQTLDDKYTTRPHLDYLSEQIRKAVIDVESGQSRRLIIEMPPRSGKTFLSTLSTSAWLLSRHADWPIALTSHDGSLATSWGRQLRRWAEAGLLGGGVSIARDSQAAGEWQTTRGGTVLSRSVRESLTGRGAKVLVIDDPHKDFIDAHSAKTRDTIWNWWLSVAHNRLHEPSLVVVIMTRWHEDDLVGRLLSSEYPGDPSQWEVVRLPALADDKDDALGRELGDPLFSPLVSETRDEALTRWAEVRETVGSYTWAAMFQQRPAPEEGAVFDAGWWRFWTTDPTRVTDDGKVVLFDPNSDDALRRGVWVESWDMAFKGTETSDYVVGQRWTRVGTNRYLVAQTRGRWSFTQSLKQVKTFAAPHVITRLVEDKANGPAVIDALRDDVDGIKPVNPRGSKESRARGVSPLVESGNVVLPHPMEPGCSWVNEFLDEMRAFPSGAHDDQVDALTQALDWLRLSSGGSVRAASGAVGRRASLTRVRR